MNLRQLLPQGFRISSSNTCANCGFLGLYIGDTIIGNVSVLHHLNLPPKEFTELLDHLKPAYDKMSEIGIGARKELLTRQYINPLVLRCRRHIWPVVRDTRPQPTRDDLFSFVTQKRHCKYFFPYSSGFTPDEHLELQREQRTNALLWKVGITSAIVGAAAAIIARYLH